MAEWEPAALVRAAGYGIFLILLWWPGNWFCRWMLLASGAPRPQGKAADAPPEQFAHENEGTPEGGMPPDEVTLRGGRYIGLLERTLILVGIVAQRWELIAGVIALKTVARYKELDQQINAEYFLIGSLASILWAIAIAFALLGFDRTMGFNIAGDLWNLSATLQ